MTNIVIFSIISLCRCFLFSHHTNVGSPMCTRFVYSHIICLGQSEHQYTCLFFYLAPLSNADADVRWLYYCGMISWYKVSDTLYVSGRKKCNLAFNYLEILSELNRARQSNLGSVCLTNIFNALIMFLRLLDVS